MFHFSANFKAFLTSQQKKFRFQSLLSI